MAAYTVIDGWAVRYALLMSPFVVDICGNLFTSTVLARRALREPAEVHSRRQYWPQIVTCRHPRSDWLYRGAVCDETGRLAYCASARVSMLIAALLAPSCWMKGT